MTKKDSRSIDITGADKATGQIARRVFLERTAGLLAGLGIAAGGVTSANATQKADKAAVSYQDSPNDGRNCAECRFYVSDGSCAIVEGDISADGWCSLWTAG